MAGDYRLVRNALVLSGLSRSDLWLRYFALGGAIGPEALRDYLDGSSELPDGQYNRLAHALNEHFTDHDLNHPVPYDPP